MGEGDRFQVMGFPGDNTFLGDMSDGCPIELGRMDLLGGTVHKGDSQNSQK